MRRLERPVIFPGVKKTRPNQTITWMCIKMEEKYRHEKKRVRACLVTEGWGEREGGRGREERRWLMGSELKNESETWQSDRLILEEMIALKRFTWNWNTCFWMGLYACWIRCVDFMLKFNTWGWSQTRNSGRFSPIRNYAKNDHSATKPASLFASPSYGTTSQ